MAIKASNNLIHVNPHQFAALLTRGDNRYVNVIGANGTGRELIVRLLGTLMQEFNPEWVAMYCREKADVVPAFDLPQAIYKHNFEPVELVSRFIEHDDNRDYTVSRGPLEDIEFESPDQLGTVMVIKDPVGFVPNDGTSFQLFTHIDGFTYTTGLGYFEGANGTFEMRSNSMMQRSLSRHLVRPLASESFPSTLDLWLSVQYEFMVGCQEFFNRYLEEGETPWEPIEDFRTGDEYACLLETNCFPANANALMTVKKKRRDKKAVVGTDGTEALKEISAVTELKFFPIPERYSATPIDGVRLAEDPEVADEFVCYIAFKLPNDAIEEQVVVTGNDFMSIYTVSLRLGDALRVATKWADELTTKHLK